MSTRPTGMPVGWPRAWRVVAGLATAFVAVLTVSSALSADVPSRARLLEAFEPDTARAAAHAAAVIGGVVLLWLSWGVMQGRRRAGKSALVVLCVVAAVNAAKGLDYEEALIALGMAAALHAGLRAAGRGSEPSSTLHVALFVVLGVAAAYATTLTVLLISGHSPGVGPTLWRAVRSLLDGGFSIGLGHTARLVLHAVAIALVAGAVLWVRALLAPAHAQDGHDGAEHARAAEIVTALGDDSIAPFVLRADKAFFFARGGVLAYRTLRETAVVAGDPVAPPGVAAAILGDFVAFARWRGWDVVVLAAAETHLAGYAGLGLRTMRIGSEAVVDPRRFTLEGRAGKVVRKAVHRVERHGWTIQLVPGAALTAEVADELGRVEQAWRQHQPRLYGFAMTMDRLWGAPEDIQDVYFVARNPSGEVRAFQRYVTYRSGLSLDAMRRLDDKPNGVSDALVAAALAHARDLGCREVSLNFSGFAHLMAVDTLERRSHRTARWALRRLHGRFQLERLARSSEKFSPEWRARYLVYTGRTRLPLVALRVLQAEAYVKPPPRRPRADAWNPLPDPVAVGAPGPKPLG